MRRIVSLLLCFVLIFSFSLSVFGLKVTELKPSDVFSPDIIKEEMEVVKEKKENAEKLESLLTFADVDPSRWSYDSIMSMTRMGLFSGTTKPIDGVGTFSPLLTMTRAQFITVITRYLFPTELLELENNKDEVLSSSWYAPNWAVAVNHNLIDGEGVWSLSNLNAPISREEMSYIMANVLEYKGEVVDSLVDSSVITDFDTISSFYARAVLTCYSLDILAGYTGGYFGPKDSVTREQGAVILHRLISPEVRISVGVSK